MGGSVKKVTGMAKSVPGVVGLAAGGNGLGMLGGKEQKGTADSFVPLDPLQLNNLKKYDELSNVNTDQIAENSIAAQENQIRTIGEDNSRKAGELVAQRGLGNSSVGLNAIINSNKNVNDQIGAVRAGLPELKFNMKTSNLNNTTNGINSIFNTRIFKQGQAAGPKSDGLLPILGMGLGAAFGGPAGAGVGMGAGKTLNQMA